MQKVQGFLGNSYESLVCAGVSFTNTMIFMGNEKSYKALNGNEEKMVAYALTNKNQIMRNSMYEYLEMELALVS